MKFRLHGSLVGLLFVFIAVATKLGAVSGQSTMTCTNRGSKCYRMVVRCPAECPVPRPSNPKAKACFLDCNSRKCETTCRRRKPNCNSLGTGCYDPRFIGGDGVVFYFHGRRDEHFSLISDPNLQINARFIGLRPTGRTRDFTWIQALGIMFRSHSFTVEATRASQWNEAIDHLQFSYDGEAFVIPEGHLSEWKSPNNKLTVERTASTNSIVITLEGMAEISLNVVPVTKEDDRVHKYHIPPDNCYAHLEVQFRFFGLSPEVEGVLGRTYRPDYQNTAMPGVAMPMVGGEDKYRTSSLLTPDCNRCLFSPAADN